MMATAIRAGARQASRDYEGAIQDYSDVLKLEPGNVTALSFRGLAFSALKKFDRAFEDYAEALRVEPQHLLTLRHRAITHTLNRSYDAVILDLNAALEIRFMTIVIYVVAAALVGGLSYWLWSFYQSGELRWYSFVGPALGVGYAYWRQRNARLAKSKPE